MREAFALLCHERLAVHHMNRGIFVPTLTREDVSAIYTLRRLVEGGAARMAGDASPAARQAVSVRLRTRVSRRTRELMAASWEMGYGDTGTRIGVTAPKLLGIVVYLYQKSAHPPSTSDNIVISHVECTAEDLS